MTLNQVTLPTVNLGRSVDFCRRMGFRQIVGLAHHARFECPAGGSTFSLREVPQTAGETHVVVYIETPDVDAEVRRLQAAGFESARPPHDEPSSWREARTNDSGGNVRCLFRAGKIRKHRPWKPKD